MDNQQFLLNNLNLSQKKAVSAPCKNILVIAGAGTGKTRVLVSRISWLLQIENLMPRQILALTFTNKAANEMKERIALIVGKENADRLWTGTFHAICLRLLRSYSVQAGLRAGFCVLDQSSQQELIKHIMGKDKYPKDLKPSMVASRINKYKEQRLRADTLKDDYQEFFFEIAEIYSQYEKQCQEQNLVDFAEIILRTVELLENNSSIRDLQHRRFKEILVDEFQDTNTLQFEFIKLMTGSESHVMAVGDDDQAIYGWRGADYRNLKRFKKEFYDVEVIALEDNYRSTQNILDVANVLIGNGNERMVDKVLVGNHGVGDKIKIVKCTNDLEEARFCALEISRLHKTGVNYSDIAVLYRTNQQSLQLEQSLTAMGIPFIIYGGQKFFERAEIQDALAYMRLILNVDDDQALRRIINVPPRRIGGKVQEQLLLLSQERGCSLYSALMLLMEYSKKAEAPKALQTLAKKLAVFYDLIENLRFSHNHSSLKELVENVIYKTGLFDYYKQKDDKENKSSFENLRHANLEQLVSNACNFESQAELLDEEDENTDDDPLLNFISRVTLSSNTELNEKGENENSLIPNVNLMTIHSSKGLEFKNVFVLGFEKGLLPLYRSSSSSQQVNEERRLAYVAVTRAKDNLFVSYAKRRFINGMSSDTGASDFLRELVERYRQNQAQKPYEIITPSLLC